MIDKYAALMQQCVEKGYGVIDDFIDHSFVTELSNELLALQHQGELRLAGIGNTNEFQSNKAIRSDFISWIDEEDESKVSIRYLCIMNELISYLNKEFDSCIMGMEFHFAIYKIGSFYRRHLDQFKNNNTRIFSLILYLSDEWVESDGGQLVLYLGDEEVRVLPKAGRIVFFRSSELEHEVLVSHRQRMSLTGWLRR